MTCCIGYYPTLSKNPQIIQGSFYEILNDPLYVKDMLQMIIPISDNTIFKERNKEYFGTPDLLTADENYYGKNMKGMGHSVSSSKTVYSGRGIHTAGNGIFDKFSHIIDNKIKDEVIDRVETDIRKGFTEVKKHIKKRDLVRKSKNILRPLAEDQIKMENKRKVYPAERLKKRLMSKPLGVFRKRTEIKNLLHRLR